MKKLIFIDDEARNDEKLTALQLQIEEFKAIFKKDGQRIEIHPLQLLVDEDEIDFLTDSGTIKYPEKESSSEEGPYTAIYNTLNSIVKEILDYVHQIKNSEDRVEIVIDLCLQSGRHPELGSRVAQYIINKILANDPIKFNDGHVIITLASTYAAGNKEASALHRQHKQQVEFAYLPIIRPEGKDPYIDHEGTAYPQFYNKYHLNPTKHDPNAKYFHTINELLYNLPEKNTGTPYGNYFGLIYARLFS